MNGRVGVCGGGLCIPSSLGGFGVVLLSFVLYYTRDKEIKIYIRLVICFGWIG